jgi:hypothetical protein
MNTIEKDYIQEAAKKLAAQMDFEILEDIFLKMGWVRLELTRHSPLFEQETISEWLSENCKGRHAKYGTVVLFEKEQDANWFTLRWSA